MGEVISLRTGTIEQVLEKALAGDLAHVIVLGITKDGAGYFDSNAAATLKDIVWMMFCCTEIMQRMLRE